MHRTVVIVGASARAAAQSAIRAGWRPWCIDLFADRDLRAVADARRCPVDAYPHGLLPRLETAPPGPVLITGALENRADLLRAVALVRPLLGSSPEAIAAVRDPGALASMPLTEGLRLLDIRRRSPFLQRAAWLLTRARLPGRRYLLKPRLGTSGRGIRHWRPGQRVDADHYLQRFVAGQPIAAVYIADGWSARMLGATLQLVGDPAVGARPFRYCGSLGPAPLTDRQHRALAHLGVQLAQRFDLRGVFGVDAVIDAAGLVCPVEVNPRYTASVEVVERLTGVAALARPAGRPAGPSFGRAPGGDDADHAPGPPAGSPRRQANPAARVGHFGKAVVYARQSCRVPDLLEVLDPESVADVPEAGQCIRPGWPICTVFAAGPDEQTCRRRLQGLAEQVYTRLSP
jgi:predicted ATP-grasp superfamily ATP-dependent carboligase